jgi:hypothetical protein
MEVQNTLYVRPTRLYMQNMKFGGTRLLDVKCVNDIWAKIREGLDHIVVYANFQCVHTLLWAGDNRPEPVLIKQDFFSFMSRQKVTFYLEVLQRSGSARQYVTIEAFMASWCSTVMSYVVCGALLFAQTCNCYRECLYARHAMVPWATGFLGKWSFFCSWRTIWCMRLARSRMAKNKIAKCEWLTVLATF